MDKAELPRIFIHLGHNTHMADSLLGTCTGKKHQIALLQLATVFDLHPVAELRARRPGQRDIELLEHVGGKTGTVESATGIHVSVTVGDPYKLLGFVHHVLPRNTVCRCFSATVCLRRNGSDTPQKTTQK